MRVIVKGVHIRLGKRLREYVERHLAGPIASVHEGEAAELEVHLVDTNGPKGGTDKECRATLRLPRTKSIHVTEQQEDFYTAISLARDRLERLARRAVGKRRTRRESPAERRPARAATPRREGRAMRGS